MGAEDKTILYEEMNQLFTRGNSCGASVGRGRLMLPEKVFAIIFSVRS